MHTFASTGGYLQIDRTQRSFVAETSDQQIVGLRFRRNRLQGVDCEQVSAQTSGESGAVQLCLFVSGWLKEEVRSTMVSAQTSGESGAVQSVGRCPGSPGSVCSSVGG